MSTLARLVAVAAIALIAAASASSGSSTPAATTTPSNPQPTAQLDPNQVVGLWKSSFGPVKIELDDRSPGRIMGIWLYDKNGIETIGFFSGGLRGNVLDFTWSEPNGGGPLLAGAGYVTFDATGSSFSGRWWVTGGARQGEWSGQRAANAAAPPAEQPPTGEQPASGQYF